jgi:hypothetical protein
MWPALLGIGTAVATMTVYAAEGAPAADWSVDKLLNYGVLGLVVIAIISRRFTTVQEMRERLGDKDAHITDLKAQLDNERGQRGEAEQRERVMIEKTEQSVRVLGDVLSLVQRTPQ